MTGSDCALLNSGTFRSDRLFPIGELTLGDLNTILPMLDRVVQMRGINIFCKYLTLGNVTKEFK